MERSTSRDGRVQRDSCRRVPVPESLVPSLLPSPLLAAVLSFPGGVPIAQRSTTGFARFTPLCDNSWQLFRHSPRSRGGPGTADMRILHTGDWHLADRLGRIDRTDDLRRNVERIAEYCRQEKVDVLLIAGDLFSELASAEALRDTIRHIQDVYAGFLKDGGTIVSLTGNHDKENFCQTLRLAMSLAAPTADEPGVVVPPGRLYLATDPTLLRLEDKSSGLPVQFLLMPYPTPTRYLTDEPSQRYQGLDEKNRHLTRAFTDQLHALYQGEHFSPELPAVLSAHIGVRGSELPTLFRLSEQEDILFHDADLPTGFHYVALGHIHKPQCLGGQTHIRYSGSLERLDLGERDDDKGVVLFDLGPEGLQGEPWTLPLDSTPIYEIEVYSPKDEIPVLRKKYANA